MDGLGMMRTKENKGMCGEWSKGVLVRLLTQSELETIM